jgi:hypothetical protein
VLNATKTRKHAGFGSMPNPESCMAWFAVPLARAFTDCRCVAVWVSGKGWESGRPMGHGC